MVARVGFVLILLLAAVTHAVRIPDEPTWINVELLARQSSIVVIGHFVPEAGIRDGYKLQVDENVSGRMTDEMQFRYFKGVGYAVQHSRNTQDFVDSSSFSIQPPQPGSKFLILLQESTGIPNLYTIPLPPIPMQGGIDPTYSYRLIACDFRPITSGDEIVAVVRDQAGKAPGPTIRLAVPGDTRFVPAVDFCVDARLLSNARGWIHDADPAMRWNGMVVLSQFGTQGDQALLLPLLHDPFLKVSGNGKQTVGYYPIRDELYDRTGSWAARPARPVISVPKDAYHSLKAMYWLILGAPFGLGLLLARLLGRARPRTGMGRGLSILATLSWTGFVLVGLLALRSFWSVDQIDFQSSGGRTEICSAGGRLQITLCETRLILPHGLVSFRRGTRLDELYLPSERVQGHNVLGFCTFSSPAGQRAHSSLAIGYSALGIPDYAVLLLFLVFPLMALLYRPRERRILIARNVCPSCGYNIQATRAQCPECGLVMGLKSEKSSSQPAAL